jgi:acyl carrier protein
MQAADTVRILTDYIVAEVALRPPESPPGPDFPIVESGLVDSLGLFKVIAFIEEKFGLEIAPEDIVLENFVNIGAIAALVERTTAAR